MAKHKKHKGYGSVLTEMNRSVKIADVYVGAALGFLGNLAINALDTAVSKPGESIFSMLPVGTAPIIKPLLGGVAAGGLLYMIGHKKNPERAVGHLAGAVAAGIGLAAKGAVSYGIDSALPATDAKNADMRKWLKLDGVPVYLNGIPIRIDGMRPYNTQQTPVRWLNGVPVRIPLNGRNQTRMLSRNIDNSVP